MGRLLRGRLAGANTGVIMVTSGGATVSQANVSTQKRAIAGNNTAAELVTSGGGAPVNQANGFSKKRARQSCQ